MSLLLIYFSACEEGTYKAGLGDTACLTCPASSESNQAGAAICECNIRSYRAMDEGPEVPCTSESLKFLLSQT